MKEPESREDRLSTSGKVIDNPVTFVFGFLTLAFLMYVAIYVLFQINGPLPAGAELGKGDWLQFFGMYLAFAGTIFVGAVSLRLEASFKKEDNKRLDVELNEAKRDRSQAIQPVFKIAVEDEALEKLDGEDRSILVINGIAIENHGQYPIRNVIVNFRFVAHLLAPGEKITFNLVEPIVASVGRGSKEDVRQMAGRTDYLTVCYDDVDGCMVSQLFDARVWEEGRDLHTVYFPLSGLELLGEAHEKSYARPKCAHEQDFVSGGVR